LPKKTASRRTYRTLNTMAAGSDWMPTAAAKLILSGIVDIRSSEAGGREVDG
jgi:Na+(H+)/acetate symporter ActP